MGILGSSRLGAWLAYSWYSPDEPMYAFITFSIFVGLGLPSSLLRLSESDPHKNDSRAGYAEGGGYGVDCGGGE